MRNINFKNLKEMFSRNLGTQDNAYKKFLIFSFVIPLPCIMLLAINLYLYDPAQLFHKPYWRPNTFFDDMRVSAKGIIDHYGFDAYILGTSMLENTSAKEAKEKLGGEWVNISLSGSTFEERAVVLEYLLKHNPPKQILYSLDYLSGLHSRNNMPMKLYNDSSADDFSFYISDWFVLCSIVWSKNKSCVGDSSYTQLREDSIVRWIQEKSHSERFGGIENWIKFRNNKQLEGVLESLSQYEAQNPKENLIAEDSSTQIQEYISKNILRFVEQNPQIQFYFVIPTYSRLNYKLKSSFSQFQSTLLWLVLEIDKLPNATLYGFDDLDYADKIANYKDLTHYNVDMNSMGLDAIRENTHILTSENIEEYLKTMESKIQEYDIEPLVKIAKEVLGE